MENDLLAVFRRYVNYLEQFRRDIRYFQEVIDGKIKREDLDIELIKERVGCYRHMVVVLENILGNAPYETTLK